MASLSSASRRNSSSSSNGRRSSRMDSLCEEDNGSVFSNSPRTTSSLLAPANGDPVARIRSPSLPVVSHPSQSSTAGIARSRSPSLPASETGSNCPLTNEAPVGSNSPRRAYYADRSDSGISDCSNHSSMLLSGSYMPALIQEEEDETCTEISGLTNGSVRFAGGTTSSALDHKGDQHALKSNSVVKSRHSVDSAIGEWRNDGQNSKEKLLQWIFVYYLRRLGDSLRFLL